MRATARIAPKNVNTKPSARWRRLGLVAALLALPLGCESASAPATAPAVPEAPAAPEPAKPAEPPKPQLPDAEGILAKAVEALGGAEKMAAIKSVHEVATVTVKTMGLTTKAESWQQGEDFFLGLNIPGVGLIEAGKQGEVLWTRDPINGLREPQGAEREQLQWSSERFVLANWQKHFKSAETKAVRDEGEGKVIDIEMTTPSGEPVTMRFDGETNLPKAWEFKQIGAMGPVPVTVEFGDYREVEGIKMPFLQTTKTSLMPMEHVVDSVKFNAEVDTSKFAKPTGGAEVVDANAVRAEQAKAKAQPKGIPFDKDGKPGRPVPAKGDAAPQPKKK